MSYQVIALKYRPQRFKEVVGQEHVTQTLSQAIQQKRIAHSYLFCGPRGTGKTTIARIFAKCLNCTGGPKVDFDDNDEKAREIAEGRSLDVLEIDAASNRGIDEIRGLRETVRYLPASSKFKVYIIDEVHMMTKEAFNALLKTLEEPPAHVKFMFATTEPEKVPATILSRCQRFDLRRIPSALIVKHLAQIAVKEGVRIDAPALYAIARGAEGGMRDAESTLDQLISFCGETIQEADVLSMFGLAAQGQLLSLAGTMLNGQVQAALRQLNDLANGGKDLGRLLSDLLNHFRNLLVFQVAKGDLSMIEVSEAEGAALAEQSKQAGTDGLARILEILGDAEWKLRDASSKKIVLEVTLLKAIEARSAVSLDSVLRQLQALRDGQDGPGTATTAAPRAAAPAAAKRPAGQSPKAAVSQEAGMELREEVLSAAPTGGTELIDLWNKLTESVGRASPFARTYMAEAHPVSFQDNLFMIGFDPEFEDHMGLFDNARNHTLVQTKLAELGHAGARVKVVKASAPMQKAVATPQVTAAPAPAPAIATTAQSVPAPAAPAPTAGPARSASGHVAKEKAAPVSFSQADFKNDPLIQKALELFRGRIVEVRA